MKLKNVHTHTHTTHTHTLKWKRAHTLIHTRTRTFNWTRLHISHITVIYTRMFLPCPPRSSQVDTFREKEKDKERNKERETRRELESKSDWERESVYVCE